MFVLVYPIGYLTASRHGLTDKELEDVLSLDDQVLQDTYEYHLPPSQHVVRLPSLLWTRIRLVVLNLRNAHPRGNILIYFSSTQINACQGIIDG